MTTADGIPPGAGILPGARSPRLRWCVLAEEQWRTLRDVRLTALRESPRSFLSTYDIEVAFGEQRWHDEFSRGEWIVAGEEGRSPVALIGAAGSYDIPPADRYLEYLWVSPRARRSGVATSLINATLTRLEAAGTETAWLWILDGNEPARELYEKCGFATTGERHHPRANPSLWEERMNRQLRPKA